ncbi:MAG: DUF4388 domain-containing protein [Acidobacteria bacterium]|nr:MAG: DUF4388 domain-containing protein [Acidobacteriota bacterium]
MSITGNLKTMELAELLEWLHRGRKTGTLFIDNGEVEKKIYFEKGSIVSSAASDPKEYLGRFLVNHGHIDEITLAQAVEMQQENKMLLGKILVTIGAISEKNLNRMLRTKAEESIYELFTWQEGDFNFVDDELPGYQAVPLSLSNVTALILEGHTRLDEWRRIKDKIPSDKVVPVTVGELAAPANDEVAERVLGLVNDERTIQEIALEAHAGEFEASRALFQQVEKGRIKMIRPRMMGNSEEPADPAPASADSVDARALLKAARKHVAEGKLEQALRYIKATTILEPNNRQLKQSIASTEDMITQRLRNDGVNMTSVPQLDCNIEEVDSSTLSRQAGFMLTRVDGTYDLNGIAKISPMSPLEAQIVIWELKQAGYIKLGKKKKKSSAR